jgi:molybdopterin converting factor small subunit
VVVHVTLHTILQIQPGGERRVHLDVPLEAGTTLMALYQMLDLRYPVEELLLVVNRAIAAPDTRLQDGDRVDFIPALSGG